MESLIADFVQFSCAVINFFIDFFCFETDQALDVYAQF